MGFQYQVRHLEAYTAALAVAGGLLVAAAPLGQAAFPGTSPVTVAHADIAGLLTTGVSTATSGADERVHQCGRSFWRR